MSENQDIAKKATPVLSETDDAVGVPKAKWFIAIVNNRHEKKYAKILTQMGIENYVPVQNRLRIYACGKKKHVDYVVIPSVIFVHCTECERKNNIVTLPFINRFMTNNAGMSTSSVNKPLAIVSDKEIDRLKFMLEQSDTPVEICQRPYLKGDKVKIIRGSLQGLEGNVIDNKQAKTELIISLEFFGYARIHIDTKNLELVK